MHAHPKRLHNVIQYTTTYIGQYFIHYLMDSRRDDEMHLAEHYWRSLTLVKEVGLSILTCCRGLENFTSSSIQITRKFSQNLDSKHKEDYGTFLIYFLQKLLTCKLILKFSQVMLYQIQCMSFDTSCGRAT